MARLPIIGNDSEAWGELLNEFLRVSHHENGTLKGVMGAVNVRDHGALGDGERDDSASFQQALNAASLSRRPLFVPPGNFLLAKTLHVPGERPIEITGSGWSSNLLWAFDGDLLQWPASRSCRECTVRGLKITAAKVSKKPQSAAIACLGGVERSLFDHLLVGFDGAIKPGSGIHFAGVSDSTTIRDCQFWHIKGTGIRIGHGSEIRIIGGRVIGDNSRDDGSIGVQLTGNNGGVHIVTTDLIALQEGLRIENSTGQGSNREIFITHATLDSCWRGMGVRDSSYISMSGCWAASCNNDNIHVEAGLSGPILSITGGTIFNAGVGGGVANGRNGITVNSGTFTLTGVHVRNNLGRGIWVPNSSVREYSINGCRINDNGQGARLNGSCYQVSNNIFARNTQPNEFLGTNYRLTSNLEC